MPDIKWIRITTDMFDDEKIKLIRKMPEADAILATWIQLICLAGKCNDGGYIYLDKDLPYNDETLAVILQRDLPIIRLALVTMNKLKMIDWEDGAHLFTLNFEKHQNIEGLERIRSLAAARNRALRERIKEARQLALPQGRDVTVTSRDVLDKRERRIDKIREEEDKNKKENTRSLFPLIKLTKEELLKLTEKYGQGEAEKRIEALSLYKQSTGKKYKSDFATILNWDRMDAEKTKPKPDKYLNQGKYDNLVCRTADDVERIRKLRDSIEGKKEDAKQQPANQ